MDTIMPTADQMPIGTAQSSSRGPVVAAIVILALLILGVIYVLSASSDRSGTGQSATPTVSTEDSSADVNDIEQDVSGIDTTELDAEASAFTQ